jgi:hypothetical protein
LFWYFYFNIIDNRGYLNDLLKFNGKDTFAYMYGAPIQNIPGVYGDRGQFGKDFVKKIYFKKKNKKKVKKNKIKNKKKVKKKN